ncbi:MAG: hypothetical protein DYG99_12175 [Bacteroidetes bacterium CHB5]|nr:hypothetical protein [Bacteroidetes bacterium CHB5]
MAKSKQNFTHQVVYSEKHHIVVTTPKGWARENRSHFKQSFNGDDVPRTREIEKQLEKIKFKRAQTAEMIIYYEFK